MSDQPPPGLPVSRVDRDDDETLLAAFVGRNWEAHYRESFGRIRTRTGGFLTFNWSAALAPLWLAYRRLWMPQLCMLVFFLLFTSSVVPELVVDRSLGAGALALVLAYVFMSAALGFAGDRLLHRRAVRAMRRTRARGEAGEVGLGAMLKAGSVSPRGVLLILSPVALFSVLLGWNSLELSMNVRAHIAVLVTAPMKSDLRNLTVAQESYFADSGTYAPTVEALRRGAGDTSARALRFWPSEAVTIAIGVATRSGWNATARHQPTSLVCGVYVGDAPPPIKDAAEGEPKCTRLTPVVLW